jgi:molybdopterin-guanine dinucleotide biosynthesis protein A
MRSPGSTHLPPIGVVLAGGAGRRIGGAKAMVVLGGQPLVAYPLDALRAVLAEVVVQAKPDTALPVLAGLTVWREPPHPRHPLFAIVHALERAAPRGVLVCAGDLPLVTPALIARLARAPGDEAAVLATAGGRTHPLLALYRGTALAPLRDALRRRPGGSVTAAVEALGPGRLAAGATELMNINTPEDLERAEALLASRT